MAPASITDVPDGHEPKPHHREFLHGCCCEWHLSVLIDVQLEITWKRKTKTLSHFTRGFLFFQCISYVKIILALLINFRKYFSSSQKDCLNCK